MVDWLDDAEMDLLVEPYAVMMPNLMHSAAQAEDKCVYFDAKYTHSRPSKDVPQQVGAGDCGVFVLKSSSAWQSDMPHFRRRCVRKTSPCLGSRLRLICTMRSTAVDRSRTQMIGTMSICMTRDYERCRCNLNAL
ncbi:unnamed protein product [Microthlaspi erraticum]|uniref:Ubiquitin-like protease family profile domain-containing protein n=1 Tax=Microthlaspi erraticum TaxID=1685480 RepID=A0A6D2KIU9_9BRAS|nr:unnamed protein product [Microthlaspi erraticum]